MDIKSRIEKIGKIFVSFNVVAEESAAYAIISMPSGWSLPDKSKLKENFKIEIAPMNGGAAMCFATEISNGPDCIFDAIDYVMDFNRELSARKELLMQKIEELKEVFIKEPVEKLKTLKFTFDEPKKPKKTASKKKAVQPEAVEESHAEAEKGPKGEIVEEVETNKLMALAQQITGE